jgi:hypothetical protein
MTAPPITEARRIWSLPPELRVLAMILLLDVCLALWFTLNWPPGMAFVVSQVPTLGVAGMIWGLLPSERTEALSEWISARLQQPAVTATLRTTLGGLVLLSTTVNTVVVQGDPVSPEWVYRFNGRDEMPHGVPARTVDEVRLRRGGGDQYFWIWMWPWGRTIWLQSTTRLINQSQHVRPWWPTRLHFDDDFGTPIALAVLPGINALQDDSVRVLITGRSSSDTVGVGMFPLRGGALLFSFGGGIVSRQATDAWRPIADSLQTLGLDSAFTAQIATTWRDAMRGARTWRRLQLNDTVQVRVFGASRTPLDYEVPIVDSLSHVLVGR